MDNENISGIFTTMHDVVAAQDKPERERLIKSLISRMSLDEKIQQMSGNSNLAKQAVMLVRYNYFPFESGENKRLGIPPIKFTDGPRGVVIGNSTCFPVSSARGAAWDPELESRVGDVIGVEARSQGANYFGGVCINLISYPGGGRAQESFGEDPYHVGAMGVALLKGVQRHAMACAKHFACNNIERSRFYVNAKVDERTLREIFLPHFKKCVDAGVASFMSAYNRLNGPYCGHNGPLLNGILKGDWKFDGFVMSDFFFGIRNGKLAANAGLDIEMPITLHYGRRLKKLVLKGEVAEGTLDEAVTRILRKKAEFQKVGEPARYGANKIACREHTDLALEAARKSIVLLKNKNGLLPLKRDKIKRIAVIGKLADVVNLGDLGSSKVRPPCAITALEGIKRASGSIEIVYDEGKDAAAAAQSAKNADAVIVVAGLFGRDEGEYVPILPPLIAIGGDRMNLNLSPDQEALIKAAANANKNCIVVLEGGSAITVESWVDDAAAILMAWYPGMEGGAALAEIIFGDVNPSAKLPITFPKSLDQLPPIDNEAKHLDYSYYHGYRLFDKRGMEPRFAFGFGLSYTKFAYSNLKLESKQIAKNGTIKVRCDVTNDGGLFGEEIVQLYIGYNGSIVDRPVKELKGFAKIALKPGETKPVSFEVKPEELAYYDVGTKSWILEEIEYSVFVGSSSRPQDLLMKDVFKIVAG